MLAGLDGKTRILFWGICLFFAFFLFSSLYIKIKQFRQKLRYINQELRRSTGPERKHWLQEKRQLWLSLLPFRGR